VWRTGYGNVYWQGERLLAHRVAWMVSRGAVPEGKNVCHRCDEPRCCRPGHLFLGEHRDNVADRHGKGRTARGEAVGTAKLTVEAVRAVRQRVAAGEAVSAVARAYGVDRKSIRRVVQGVYWQWLDRRES